jgi:hypothetical protein
MKEHSSRMLTKNVLFNERVTLAHIHSVPPSVLDKQASLALMTMPLLALPTPNLKSAMAFMTAL